MTRADRIARERQELRLAPWELSPSEIDDGPSPWTRGSAGHASWERARALRAEYRQRDPHYFGGDAG